jgi:hypothetical protein
LALTHATIAVPTSLRGCHFDEPVDVSHASATSLDLTGSHLPRLQADGVTVAGDLQFARVRGGPLGLFGAHIGGNLWLNGAELIADDEAYALNCPQLRVGGGLYAGKHGGPAMSAVGGINVWGADIGYSMELDGACLTRRKGFALRGHGLKVGHDLSCAAIEMPNGGMVLFAATIGGQVWLNGSQITANDGEYAISAPMLRVTGGVYGPDMKAQGGVNLFSASVGESVSLGESTLVGGLRHALRAPGAVLQGDLDLHNTHIRGLIDLSRSSVAGRIRLTGAAFEQHDIATVDLTNAHIGHLSMAGIAQQPDVMDLRDATIRIIEDRSDQTPARLELDGLAYEYLRPADPVEDRLRWLSHGDASQPQPYEQLAGHYRRLGHDQDARTVLLARHRARRRGLTLLAKTASLFEDITTGYGYRPTRALAWFLALVVTVTAVFAANPPVPVGTTARPFHPLAYAFDLVLPILDLGQERAYSPTAGTQWVAWTASLIGWLLATAIIAGITRRVTRT